MPSVCALLPSVSENARNSASTAISSAIFLFECAGMFGVLGVFRFSCAPGHRSPSARIVGDDERKPAPSQEDGYVDVYHGIVTRADGRCDRLPAAARLSTAV